MVQHVVDIISARVGQWDNMINIKKFLLDNKDLPQEEMAAKLIKEFGSIEAVIEATKPLHPVVKEKKKTKKGK